MADSFPVLRYLGHLRRRVLFLSLVCASTLFLALVASLLLPRGYTATARILIDPPAGSDQRMMINPVYLESLKTYEVEAKSEHLFSQAMDHLGLRGSKPIDQLQSSVIKAAIPRNTRILEITATWPDARLAQSLALYVAQQVVDLSRFSSGETDKEIITTAEKGLKEARAGLFDAERAFEDLESGPVNQSSDRSAKIDMVQVQRDAARWAFASAQKRLQEARLGVGYRGERLTIIDPGVVPERPSSPNIPLNLVVALLTGLAAALVYLAVDSNNTRYRKGIAPAPVRLTVAEVHQPADAK